VVPGLIINFTKHQKNAVLTMHAMQPVRVCDMCRTNYSHPDFKYGNKHLPFMGELELWHDPRHQVGRAGFKYRRRRAPFNVVFLKTVRCHLNSILYLFMNLHYSAVRNRKRFKVLSSHQIQKCLCRFDDTYNAADARFWYALKYGNKHLPVMGESALWHDPRSRVGRVGSTPVLSHRIFFVLTVR
jgi:hypothetical protein